MNSYENTWRDSKDAFNQQLERNIWELKNQYPPHWRHFLQHIQYSNVKKVVDVGCGAGVLYAVLCHCFPGVEYHGYDYAPQAIELARETWKTDRFTVCDYHDVPPEAIDEKTLIVANALADVLPDGNECVEHLLRLGTHAVSLLRVRTTNRSSYFDIHDAYDIKTYAFYHNYHDLKTLINQYGYDVYASTYHQDIQDILCYRDIISLEPVS